MRYYLTPPSPFSFLIISHTYSWSSLKVQYNFTVIRNLLHTKSTLFYVLIEQFTTLDHKSMKCPYFIETEIPFLHHIDTLNFSLCSWQSTECKTPWCCSHLIFSFKYQILYIPSWISISELYNQSFWENESHKTDNGANKLQLPNYPLCEWSGYPVLMMKGQKHLFNSITNVDTIFQVSHCLCFWSFQFTRYNHVVFSTSNFIYNSALYNWKKFLGMLH